MQKISQADLVSLRSRAEGAISRARKSLEKADQVVDQAVKTTVTGVTAFGCGVAQGRYGGIELMGVPSDLLLGVAAHGLAFAGVGGRATAYMHAAGDGALACYLSTVGRGVGGDWKDRTLSGGSTSRGALNAAAGAHTIPDADLAAMARGARR